MWLSDLLKNVVRNLTLYSQAVTLYRSAQGGMKTLRLIKILNDVIATWRGTLVILRVLKLPGVWLGLFFGASLIYLLLWRSLRKNTALE
jgi:hypothetical protein